MPEQSMTISPVVKQTEVAAHAARDNGGIGSASRHAEGTDDTLVRIGRLVPISGSP
jgi:hypothetical protein